MPGSELAVDQHAALMDRRRRPMLEGDLVDPRKQASQKFSIEHGGHPSGAVKLDCVLN
jgi:hypothetical protein